MLIGEYKNSNNYIPVKIKENVWIVAMVVNIIT